MGALSKIEWTTHTFNPWIGCTKISPACDDCYAARSTPARVKGIKWGARESRVKTSEDNWLKPLRWNAQAKKAGKPAYVFCASLSDIFDNHPSIQWQWRLRLYRLWQVTPWLIWQILTKRPQNIEKLGPEGGINKDDFPNVWLGTTVENQAEAERRIPHLMKVDAAKRFLSIEPFLGPVDLKSLDVGHDTMDVLSGETYRQYAHAALGGVDLSDQQISQFLHENEMDVPENLDAAICPKIDWVILGGESGHGARPFNLGQASSLVADCDVWGVPVFVKQLGNHPVFANGKAYSGGDGKHNDPSFWPRALRVRQMPHPAHPKRTAVRLLDVIQKFGYPTSGLEYNTCNDKPKVI